VGVRGVRVAPPVTPLGVLDRPGIGHRSGAPSGARRDSPAAARGG
jgi:hypothetical protein